MEHGVDHKSYHGDSTRDHQFWKYDGDAQPENFLRWDFKDEPHLVCSNYTSIDGRTAKCNGHDQGCKLFPSYHGDSSRQHRFWIYPQNHPLVNSKWDFHKNVCDNSVFVKKRDDILEYRCLGHHLTFHGDASRDNQFWVYRKDQLPHDKLNPWDSFDPAHKICSNHQEIEAGHAYRCLGHSRGDHLQPSFHGDAGRGHKFWVYPTHAGIVNPQWDFRTERVCTNYEQGPTQHNGVKEYTCKGHQLSFHGDTTRNHNFWIYPKGSNPPNADKWDYVGKHSHKVCSYHDDLGNGTYQCKGHSTHGDRKKVTHHGDATRDWSFWVYPPHMDLVSGNWDFRINPCGNAEHVGTDGNGVAHYRCRGHKCEKN